MFSPHLMKYGHHLAAQVLVMIRRRNREVAFLVTRTVAEVVLLAPRIPASFFGVDEVIARVGVGVEADVVEDEELRFGAEIGRIGKAAVLEVELGLLGNPARIAIVVLPRNRIDDVGRHDQRRHFGERVHAQRSCRPE